MTGARTETHIAARSAGERAVDWERVYELHASTLIGH
jgi:hypothetical protein